MKSRVLQAALVAVAVFGVAAPAFADRDDRGHDRHEWREHERHERREHRPGVVYQPGYVYAPPPVVYAPPPPPPLYAGPSLNITIPIR